MKRMLTLLWILAGALLLGSCAEKGYATAYTGDAAQMVTMRAHICTPTPIPRPSAAPQAPQKGLVYGDYIYTDNGDGTAEITGMSEKKATVRIPETIGELTVTSIGYRAFFRCSDMEAVRFPKTLLFIGNEAFAGCTTLSEAILPDTVERLGARAFAGCTQLMSVHLPAGLCELGYGTFSDCTKLVAITVPAGVTALPDCAFAGCNELMFAVLPKTLTSVGLDAFFGCDELVLRAYAGAYAETWAAENDYTFIFLTGGDS